jgi:hypothetical protein
VRERRLCDYDTIRVVSSLPYRVPAPTPPDPYMAAWVKLRRRQRVWAISFCALVVAVMFACAALHASWWILLIPAVSLVPLYVAAARVAPFRCPSCTEPFFRSMVEATGFTRACAHCGIPIGTPKP